MNSIKTPNEERIILSREIKFSKMKSHTNHILRELLLTPDELKLLRQIKKKGGFRKYRSYQNHYMMEHYDEGI